MWNDPVRPVVEFPLLQCNPTIVVFIYFLFLHFIGLTTYRRSLIARSKVRSISVKFKGIILWALWRSSFWSGRGQIPQKSRRALWYILWYSLLKSRCTVTLIIADLSCSCSSPYKTTYIMILKIVKHGYLIQKKHII